MKVACGLSDAVVVAGALLGKIGGEFLPSLHPEMQRPSDLIKVRPGRMRDFFRLSSFSLLLDPRTRLLW